MSDQGQPSSRLAHLHGIVSRSDDRAIETEVERLNAAAMAAGRSMWTPWDQPGDFPARMLELADPWTATRIAAQASDPIQASSGSGSTHHPLPSQPIRVLAARIRAGQVHITELVEAAIARAEATNAQHHAFIEIHAQRARERAAVLEAELAAGRDRGVLHGIPLAHKDCFEQIGRAPTVGSRATSLPTPQRAASVLERLDAAGAVDIGVLNLNEMVAGPTGHNPHFGDCANAIDPERISGGSSSGSAVAVGLGAVCVSLGSDTGGSIRIPGAANGLVALKPTYGRVSRAGCVPRALSLDCIGPLARTVDDCQLVFDAIAGPDARDPSSLLQPSPDRYSSVSAASSGHRLAVLEAWGTLEPEIDQAFKDFLDRAARTQGGLQRVSGVELDTLYAMGDIISKVEAATLHGRWMQATPDRYSKAVYSRTEPGFHLSGVRYLEAIGLRARLMTEFVEQAFASADVVLFPAIPVPIPLRRDADMESGSSVFTVVPQLTRLTRPFSYLGLPVLVIPVGLDRNGMPVSAQLIGRPFAEARLFDLARRLLATG
jgi:aspartyl-tRNA(Asn)/glutamyl-tRNA(Gln) amidotransferase subunit A